METIYDPTAAEVEAHFATYDENTTIALFELFNGPLTARERNAGQWNQYAQNYQNDAELLEWQQIEAQASEDFTSMRDAVRNLRDDNTNQFANGNMDSRDLPTVLLNYEYACNELEILGASYAAAISSHENLKSQILLSEMDRRQQEREERAIAHHQIQRQAGQLERDGQQAEVTQAARRLQPPRFDNQQGSSSNTSLAQQRTRGHHRTGGSSSKGKGRGR